MPFHRYRASSQGESPRWFGIRIEYVDDRWVSTCHEVDAEGDELPGAATIAPRFYGVTAEQAHRRMLDALDHSFDEVVSEPFGEGS
jgi:hypothetical protein